MIEAGAILFVLVVSLGAYLSARLGAQRASLENPQGDLEQLKQYREVLRQKAIRGQQENWDSVMMLQLGHRLEEIEQQIELTTGLARKQEFN